MGCAEAPPLQRIGDLHGGMLAAMTTPTHVFDALEAARTERHTSLCVGLDPRIARIPKHLQHDDVERTLTDFCLAVVERTEAYAACWKPNIAFFEAHGIAGLRAFVAVCKSIRARGGRVVGDAKRSDMGSTAEAYASAFLEPGADFEVDALTLNPYLGREGLTPFVERAHANGKGLYVLVRTSNSGAADLQEQRLHDGRRVFDQTAAVLRELGDGRTAPASGLSTVGAVVGATSPEALAHVRTLMPETPFLVPGFGAQGATAADVAPAFRKDGSGVIVNASRSIIHPAVEDDAWSDAVVAAARQAAEGIHAVASCA